MVLKECDELVIPVLYFAITTALYSAARCASGAFGLKLPIALLQTPIELLPGTKTAKI